MRDYARRQLECEARRRAARRRAPRGGGRCERGPWGDHIRSRLHRGREPRRRPSPTAEQHHPARPLLGRGVSGARGRGRGAVEAEVRGDSGAVDGAEAEQELPGVKLALGRAREEGEGGEKDGSGGGARRWQRQSWSAMAGGRGHGGGWRARARAQRQRASARARQVSDARERPGEG